MGMGDVIDILVDIVDSIERRAIERRKLENMEGIDNTEEEYIQVGVIESVVIWGTLDTFAAWLIVAVIAELPGLNFTIVVPIREAFGYICLSQFFVPIVAGMLAAFPKLHVSRIREHFGLSHIRLQTFALLFVGSSVSVGTFIYVLISMALILLIT